MTGFTIRIDYSGEMTINQINVMPDTDPASRRFRLKAGMTYAGPPRQPKSGS